jgi:hypothetical protein
VCHLAKIRTRYFYKTFIFKLLKAKRPVVVLGSGVLDHPVLLKKFLEIKSEIPKEFQDINKLTYLQLVKLIDRGYYQLLNQKMIEKFSEENPNLTKEQIIFYLNNYNENFGSGLIIPDKTVSAPKLSLVE